MLAILTFNMKQDQRHGILIRCRVKVKLDRISTRLHDTHHEVGLEEMVEIEEHIIALDKFMKVQPVDDPLYPGTNPRIFQHNQNS